MNQDLIAQLKRHEGFRSKPYQCSANKTTIGYGRNLQDVGITEGEAVSLLNNDIQIATVAAETFVGKECWTGLSDTRKCVLINMVFNLGLPRLMYFHKFRAALLTPDFVLAAREMLDSKWATQVGDRAQELAKQMNTGKWQQ